MPEENIHDSRIEIDVKIKQYFTNSETSRTFKVLVIYVCKENFYLEKNQNTCNDE